MKTQTKSELDLEMIQRLYHFGSLRAYRVLYFQPITFQVGTDMITFSEEEAKAQVAAWQQRGYKATIQTEIITFNGAFARKGKV